MTKSKAKTARKHEDTTLPPLTTDFESTMKALLKTPPPPAGHPSTRKKTKPKPKTRKSR